MVSNALALLVFIWAATTLGPTEAVAPFQSQHVKSSRFSSHVSPLSDLQMKHFRVHIPTSSVVTPREISKAERRASLLQTSDACNTARLEVFDNQTLIEEVEQYEFNNQACFQGVTLDTMADCTTCLHDHERVCRENGGLFTSTRIRGPIADNTTITLDVNYYECIPAQCANDVDVRALEDQVRDEFTDLNDVFEVNITVYQKVIAPDDESPFDCRPVEITSQCQAGLDVYAENTEFVAAETSYFATLANSSGIYQRGASLFAVLGSRRYYEQCQAIEGTFCQFTHVVNLNAFSSYVFDSYRCYPPSCGDDDDVFLFQLATARYYLALAGVATASVGFGRTCDGFSERDFHSDACYVDQHLRSEELEDRDFINARAFYSDDVEVCLGSGLNEFDEDAESHLKFIDCRENEYSDRFRSTCEAIGEDICQLDINFLHFPAGEAMASDIDFRMLDCINTDCQNQDDILVIEKYWIDYIENRYEGENLVRADATCGAALEASLDDGRSFSNAQIAGAAIGALAALCIVVGGCCVYQRRKRRRGEIVGDDDDDVVNNELDRMNPGRSED